MSVRESSATLNQPPSRLRGTVIGTVALSAVLAGAATTAVVAGGDRPRWLEAVGFAAAVCLAASLGGWLVSRAFQASPAGAVAGGLGGIAVRILPPLAALGWLNAGGRDLRDAGAGGLLVAFYLALLATDILLHIMMAPKAPAPFSR
ncbi:MAG: hypothetical protein WCJ18_02670 [Planctomycetota bacterium]